MRFRDHAGCADVGCEAYECGLPDHAFGLAAGGCEGGGGCHYDGVLGVRHFAGGFEDREYVSFW